jgi:type IV fimbrial biogenesis protein FimT
MKTQSSTGFTLIELMTTLAVAAIILALGVPSFRDMLRNNRLTSYANEMVIDLNFARNQAIKTGGGVFRCPGTANYGNPRVTISKTGANWEDGWTVFVDYPSPNCCDSTVPGSCVYGVNENMDVGGDPDGNPDGIPDEIVLRKHEPLAANYTLRGNNNFTNYLSYLPNGRSNTMGSFVICDDRDGKHKPQRDTSRVVIVNNTGRVRIGPDLDKTGIPEDDDGKDITTCNP